MESGGVRGSSQSQAGCLNGSMVWCPAPRPGSNCGNGQRYGGRVTDTARPRPALLVLVAEGKGIRSWIGFSFRYGGFGTPLECAAAGTLARRPPCGAVQCFASPAWPAAPRPGGRFEPAMDGREGRDSPTVCPASPESSNSHACSNSHPKARAPLKLLACTLNKYTYIGGTSPARQHRR